VSTTHGIERRNAILTAARELLEENGLLSMNMREISRRSGVGLSTLYFYFSTKEEIFVTIYLEGQKDQLARMKAIASRSRSVEAFLVRVIDDYFSHYEAYGRYYNLAAAARDAGTAELPDLLIESMVSVAREIGWVLHDGLAKVAERDGRRVVGHPMGVPLLWATMMGVADQFTFGRDAVHRYSRDELTRFAAIALRDTLTEPVS